MHEPVVSVPPEVVKRTTAARMLDCGETKIRDLCKAGKLKTIRLGADYRVTVASIREFVMRGGDAA